MAVFKREAADLREGAGRLGESIDAELARRERKLSASPEERIEMILEDQDAGDARFEELRHRVLGDADGDPEPDPPA